MNNLPFRENTVIPISKLTDYALNPLKDIHKSTAFNIALGYDLNNVVKLIENIRNNIDNFDAIEKPDLGYGERYQIIMELVGENRRKANVLTAWIADERKKELRLISTYVVDVERR
jgi:predicted lactoylglutathione lyase